MKIRPSKWVHAAVVATVLLGVGACTTQQVRSSNGSTSPGMGPVLSVERFLQAANSQDFGTMAALFGTADGPIGGRREEVELRMSAIAAILAHDDYEIGAEALEPGRTNPTQRISVTLVQGDNTYENVPFLVVQSNDGAWLVEEIALEQITSR